MAEETILDVPGLAAEVVAAYLSHNRLALSDLPTLIASVYASLAKLDGLATPEPEPARVPAVPIRRSITPDYIICLEDGRKFKSLKRHLRTKYDLSPEAYREKWGLAKDYPMVAPDYAKARSALALAFGLGQGGRRPAPAPAKPPEDPPRAPAAAEAKSVVKRPAKAKAAAKATLPSDQT
jgi:predicted transcriptional regulator